MEAGQAQRFVAAFASFGVFALAYTQFSDVVRIAPHYNLPASMSETIEVLVVLFFVSSNMIMMLRSLTMRGVDENRSILLALLFMAAALLMMFTAKVIDSRYVLEFGVGEKGAQQEMVLIRPLTLSAEARDTLLVDDPRPVNFIENRSILTALDTYWVAEQEKFDVLVVDNGYVAFTYALFIALSKGLLLFSFSLLTWAAVMLVQKTRPTGDAADPAEADGQRTLTAIGAAKALVKSRLPRRRATVAKDDHQP